MTLYQRFDSLRNSMALLREQTLHTAGLEDWPSVQTHMLNLLSHTYSIAAALQSPTPQFLASQLATLDAFLENEAQDVSLFGEDEGGMSSLFGGAAQDAHGGAALPSVEDKDANSQLPQLSVHPAAMIADGKLNWLGTLLSTVPEADVQHAEAASLAGLPEDVRADASAHLAAHDDRCRAALRAWHQALLAPDADGNTYDFMMRVDDD